MTYIYSSQLWEIITGKKSPYKPQNIDSSAISNMNEKKRAWIENMLKTVDDWNPESHGYKFAGRGMVHGTYYFTPDTYNT